MQLNTWKSGLILSLIIGVILSFIAVGLDPTSTGDSGDSIMHYLFSRYSFEHPNLFFNHWAKPVFVLLSSPFAQFGFKGIMFFNILCATGISFITYLLSLELKVKNPLLVFLLLFFSPLYFKLIFSGLTEYLFALFLIGGLYLWKKSFLKTSLIIVSFLPLIRSEGLIILSVFVLFLIVLRHWKLIPYLLIGQIAYSLIGSIFYKDLLWVIHEIPYSNLGTPYGKGELFDFIHRLNYVIEKPILFLLGIGILGLLITLFKKKISLQSNSILLLIATLFTAYIGAHSIFWWLGIFNSMGLPRVLIAVVPLTTILAVYGLDFITDLTKKPILQKGTVIVFSLLILIFPFTDRQWGVVFNEKLFDVPDNELIHNKIVPFLKEEFPDYQTAKFYYSHPYFSLALNHDFFDTEKHQTMVVLESQEIEDHAIILWDDWFSTVEEQYEEHTIPQRKRIKLEKRFVSLDGNRTIQFSVFSKW